MPSVIKSQLIEIVIPAASTATKIQFQDFPYLRGKQITGIETFTVNDISTSPTGKTVVTNAIAIKSYLTLYLNDLQNPNNVGEWIQNVPLASMHRVQNSANDAFVRKAMDMVGQVVYWEKCYITLGSAAAPVADTSYLFNIYFKG